MAWGLLFYSLVAASAGAELIWPASTIYGQDDRRLVDPTVPREISMLAQSVGALFLKRDVTFRRGQMWRESESLGRAYGLCRQERFVDLPSSAECTGFLITSTRIATAGHCIPASVTCNDIIWAFDYTEGQYTWDGERLSLPQSKTYRCKRILAKHDNRHLDYAVIELDRPVEDRWPLKLANSAEIHPGEEIFALGFPQGIPMVWSSMGQVRRREGRLKVFAQIDLSEGNSGSPIFASNSLDVLGVLIEGEEDLSRNRRNSCNQSVMCDQQGCRGEVFLMADVLKPFVN